MVTEHMSRGCLSGNLSEDAIELTRKLLRKMNTPSALKAEKALLHASFVLYSAVPSGKSSKEKARKLEVGESLALSINLENHAMMMVITRTPDVEGKKRFKLEMHNTGKKINMYHYRRIDQGKEFYQTPIEIVDIPEENLLGKRATFFNSVISSTQGSIQSFYEKIIPLTGGRVCPPREKSSPFWRHPQTGGSCTASCLRSVINSMLPAKENQEFEEMAAYELLFKTYQQILSGEGNTTTQKVVALEMVKMIQHSVEKKGGQLPSELHHVKSRLAGMVAKKSVKSKLETLKKALKPKPARWAFMPQLQRHKVKLNGIPLDVGASFDDQGYFRSRSPSDYLNVALTSVKEEDFKKVEFYVLKAQEAFQKSTETLTANEINKFIQISSLITKYAKNTPLDKQATDHVTAISAILHLVGASMKLKAMEVESQIPEVLRKQLDSSARNNLFFFYSLCDRFNIVSLNHLSSDYITLIISQLNSIHIPLYIPPGLQVMIQKMGNQFAVKT